MVDYKSSFNIEASLAKTNFYSDIADDISSEKKGIKGNRWIKSINEAFEGINFLHAAKTSHLTSGWVEI